LINKSEEIEMIKITSLYKVYRSRLGKKTYALTNLNLNLPDTGLVFVLGKSGSGKSTLLNLIGGLDKITHGQIEVDGNDISKLSEHQMCNYRNTHIGFIFQDYHLIDDLTVYENIATSLHLRRVKDQGHVSEALARVGLAGYEKRYPSELSGGERQRVAIARAIVKNPRVILADEPTGNLDPNTATSIISLLQSLSQDRLIMIVSHNIRDAKTYADRIIELSNGQVSGDFSRNPKAVNCVSAYDNIIIYPEGRELSDADIEFINSYPRSRFYKQKDKYIPTRTKIEEGNKVEIEREKLSFSKKMRMSRKFLAHRTATIALSSFMVAVVMVIMALAQTVIGFDSSRVFATELEKAQQQTLLLKKGIDKALSQQYGRNYLVAVTPEDIQAFYDADYDGNIYPVLSHTVPIKSRAQRWSLGGSYFSGTVYLNETLGTIIVDDAFLKEKFGEYTYAAKLDEGEIKPYGVYVTDYVADAIIATNSKYRNRTYEDVLGAFYYQDSSLPQSYINGIIHTGYKERYQTLFDYVKQNKKLGMSDLYEMKDFQNLTGEIYDSLGYCFTTNPNFVEDVSKTALHSLVTPHYRLSFDVKEGISVDLIESNPLVYSYYYRSNAHEHEQRLGGSFMYTTALPQIPTGAKYIRVVFNDDVDRAYGLDDEVSTRDSALLRFDDNEPISQELMNSQRTDDPQKGIGLDMLTGEVTYTGSSGTTGWISEYIEIPEGAKITEFAAIALRNYAYCAFYDADKNCIGTKAALGDDIEDDSIVLNYQRYNEIFGTSYTALTLDTFVPHKATITHYDYDDEDHANPMFQKEVTICALHSASGTSSTMFAGQNVYNLFLEDAVRPTALYLDSNQGLGGVLSIAEERNYEPQSFIIEGIHTMTRAVEVFIPLFELVAIVLCAGIIFILINFSTRVIKDKMHEIGILKAVGTQNGTVAAIFGLQMFLIAVLTCVMMTIGYYFFIDLANDVLIESLRRIAPSYVMLDLEFLTFQTSIVRDNCIMVAILTIISLVIPMAKIKTIKPIQIIKTRD
jgi:putative ABC transport system ATP-binding protein